MKAYYIDLGTKEVRKRMFENFVFDENSIPLYKYDFGEFYNISFICYYALYNHSLYLKYHNIEKLDYFLKVARWIIDNGQESDKNFIFPHLYKWNDQTPPWISALGQGRLLSVFSRAYEISNEERFAVMAQKALRPYNITVQDGGIQSSFFDGNIAFEEYPAGNSNIVLNGFITSLVGLHDLAEIVKNKEASILFKKGINSLEKNMHNYDLGYWSKYSINKPLRISNDEYHNYHIIQLWALYEMTGNIIFKQYSEKWQNYKKGLRLSIIRNIARFSCLAYKINKK